ncbi:nodulation protein NfeD [Rhodoblastus sp. 17X3]|uniref:NfeD family protein n=1 Tax=Rhodoblastus sp. 17X3 TaxID=3047026 RepID=UPI0024B79386|nr:nodulation protein NfeD [Rhodoblastus sp. 17X3]MDI9849640.1 nodulation protein NfeD [Rhodoblastus sp. 17X3]
MTRASFIAALVATFWIAVLGPASATDNSDAGLAVSVAIDGPIGPATARYVSEALTTARERHATVIVLRLNTPGGLVESMRDIVADLLASPIPVVGYVAPSGGRAASAGTYILYATHVAAMAPGTNLGAATPVQVGGPVPGLPDGDKKDDDVMAHKMVNDAVAFIRSLAELRGRNADWAEKAVRDGVSLSASAALQAGVIELIASDQRELLEKIDGRTVNIVGVGRVDILTRNLPVEPIEPAPLIRFLSIITNPNVAIILMLIGVYGVIFELSNPGAVAPGVIGAICLTIGFYALNLLPINYFGLALVLLGVVLLTVEAFHPTMVVGLGGLASFILGLATLFRVEPPGFEVSWIFVAAIAAMIFSLIAFVGRGLIAARRLPARVGGPAMRGLSAEILDWRGRAGHVLVRGERWRAQGEETFDKGQAVEVTNCQGLTLLVQRPANLTANIGEFR